MKQTFKLLLTLTFTLSTLFSCLTNRQNSQQAIDETT